METRRILFGTTTWLSLETFLRPQLEELTAHGWEVHLASSGIPDNLVESRITDKLQLHEVSMERTPALLRDLASLWRWVRLLRHVRPHVAVMATPKASLLGLSAAWLTMVPARVYWVWGLRSETERGLRRGVLRTAEKLTVVASTTIQCVSSSLETSLRRSAPASARKASAIVPQHANGIRTNFFFPANSDQKQFARRTLCIPEDPLVVGFIGRLNRDKGIDVLVDAIEIVTKKLPNIFFLITGDHDHTNPPHTIGEEGLNSNSVATLPFQRDPRTVFHALDVFVMPSLREGLSTVNLEAASCGLPVVTTSATGCVDSILPGKSGLLVPPNDSESLAGAILQLLGDHQLRTEMGRRGREWVTSKFSQDEVWRANRLFLDSL